MPISTVLIVSLCLAFLVWWQARLRQAESTAPLLDAHLERLESVASRHSAWLQRTGFTPQRRSLSLVTDGALHGTKHATEAATALRRVWLFSELTSSHIDLITRIAQRRKIKNNQVIVRQGDREGADLYCALRGYFKVTMHGHHDQEVLINIVQPGECFGEIAFLDQQGRSATVTALDDGELLIIRREDIEPLLESVPRLAIAMLTAQSRLVRNLTERAEDNAFLDVRSRLAKRLVTLADHLGTSLGPQRVELKVRLTPQDLGDMVQAQRTSIDRCLREWCKQGLIHREDGRLVIVDRQRLQEVAAGVA